MDGVKTGLARLKSSNLHKPPRSMGEHERVLRIHSRGMEHISAIVDRVLGTMSDWPTPAQLIILAELVPVPAAEQAYRTRCRLCVDGWVHGHELLTRRRNDEREWWETERITADQHRALTESRKIDPRMQRLYEGVERCQCRGGK